MNDTIALALRPLKSGLAASVTDRLAEFWVWWTAEILDMLPPWISDFITRRNYKLFVEPEFGDLHVRYGRSADDHSLLRVSPGMQERVEELPATVQETILLLNPDQVLVTTVELPSATEENLREVLAFEMDKYTPFPASRVYFDFVVLKRDRELELITVEIVAAPRESVDKLIDDVSQRGFQIDVVTSRGRDGSNLRSVNLLPDDKRQRRSLLVSNTDKTLAAICALLLLLSIVLPIQQKLNEIEQLRPSVEEAQATAHEGAELRRELESMAQTSRFLAEKKKSSVLAVQIIDEISRILPDHTSLGRLSVSSSSIEIQGQSTSSADLIELIDSSPLFESARFTSPVQQIASTNMDRFHLSANLEGMDPK